MALSFVQTFILVLMGAPRVLALSSLRARLMRRMPSKTSTVTIGTADHWRSVKIVSRTLELHSAASAEASPADVDSFQVVSLVEPVTFSLVVVVVTLPSGAEVEVSVPQSVDMIMARRFQRRRIPSRISPPLVQSGERSSSFAM